MLRELGRINSELAAQRRLNAMTVHDLSNPAQVILGLSEVLLEHQVLDPMVRRHLEQLHRSAVTMTALITDLSHGFSLDDTESLELERLDLVELVTSVVERMHLLAEAKDMKVLLFAEQPDHRACWIDGDSVRLERALVNLLGNAIKFSPAGSHVTVAVDRGVHFAKVSIRDQGPGISEDGKARIFEVFHREEGTCAPPGPRSRAVHHQADRGEPRRDRERGVGARRRGHLPDAGAAGRARPRRPGLNRSDAVAVPGFRQAQPAVGSTGGRVTAPQVSPARPVTGKLEPVTFPE